MVDWATTKANACSGVSVSCGLRDSAMGVRTAKRGVKVSDWIGAIVLAMFSMEVNRP